MFLSYIKIIENYRLKSRKSTLMQWGKKMLFAQQIEEG